LTKAGAEDLSACNNARCSEPDTKLTVANQELGVFRQAAEARQRKLDELQNQEKQLRERLSKELTDKNVEIEQLRGQIVMRMPDKVVFKSGSADILPQGAEVLDKLADAIKDSVNVIRVEGHTDDTPISGKLKTKYPSNWEFSAARASAVARYFETKHFINPNRLESLGFSMYHPLAPNDSEENKQRNRRIDRAKAGGRAGTREGARRRGTGADDTRSEAVSFACRLRRQAFFQEQNRDAITVPDPGCSRIGRFQGAKIPGKA
jgi:chemotaxis protein MotB